MNLPHETRRRAALAALEELLERADAATRERARQNGHPTIDTYGCAWESIPKAVLNRTEQLCREWEKGHRLCVGKALMSLAAQAILAAESLPLWDIPGEDTETLAQAIAAAEARIRSA